MVKQKISIPTLGAPSSGQKAYTVDLPPLYRYHELQFGFGYSSGTNTIAAAIALLTEIRLLINNRVQRTISATELRDWLLLNGTQYDFNGLPNSNAQASGENGVGMVMPFAPPWVRDRNIRDALALATRWAGGGYNSVQVQFDFGAATTPTLTVDAVVDEWIPERQPEFLKFKKLTQVVAGTKFNFALEPSPDRLVQLSLYPEGGSGSAYEPTKVVLKRGPKIWQEFLRTANKAHLQHHGMTPAASGRTAKLFDIVPAHDDLMSSAIPLDGGLLAEIHTASAASGNVVAIAETYGLPD